VLTDESMPGMTGSELARAILALRPELPVIMMSGHVVASLEERAEKAGVCLLLHKPLAARELARSLAQCLAGESSPPPQVSIDTPTASGAAQPARRDTGR
jgi:FixJ family two-component response regulator